MNKVRSFIPLICVFLLAVFFRTINLGGLPATFFVDEVLSGYLGRYILTNGFDLYGNAWPFPSFNKFGDFYIIAPMYLDGVSSFLFGLSRFAVRFPTALLGAATIFPVFGIARRIWNSSRVGLLSAIVLAILPWHIVLSRATTESVLELCFLSMMIWAYLTYQDFKRTRWLIISIALGFGSYWIYHTARLLVPLTWMVICISQLKNDQLLSSLRSAKLFLMTTLAFLLLTFWIGTTEWGRGRLEQTSIFSEQSGVSIRMTEMTYNLGNGSVLLARIFHNKLVGFGREFLNQYATYFSTRFLFTSDSWIKTRYAVPESGPLYYAILFMLFGFFLHSKHKLDFSKLLLTFGLLFISVLPASLTYLESPSIRRSIFFVLPIVILAGEGLHRLFLHNIRAKLFGVLIVILLIGEVIYFSYMYWFHSDLYSAMYRTDGMPEIASYITHHHSTVNSSTQFLVLDAVDFPLYYLFESNNFDPNLATQFRFGLDIDRIDQVVLSRKKCFSDLTDQDKSGTSVETIIIQPEFCNANQSSNIIKKIQGVNPLIRFDVLRLTKPDEQIPTE